MQPINLFKISALSCALLVLQAAPIGSARPAGGTPAGTTAAGDSGQQVTFSGGQVSAGARLTSTQRIVAGMHMEVFAGGKRIVREEMSKGDYEKKIETVRKVSGGQPVELTVHYRVAHGEQSKGNRDREKTEAVEGNTYLVKRSGGQIKVTYSDGSAPHPREVRFVRKDYKDLGQPDSFRTALVGKTLTVGQRVPFLEQSFRSSVGQLGDMRTKRFRMVFAGTRKCADTTCGVFAVVWHTHSRVDRSMKLALQLKGEALVTVKGSWPHSFNLKGPMIMGGRATHKGQVLTLKGGGQMSARFDFERTAGRTAVLPAR